MEMDFQETAPSPFCSSELRKGIQVGDHIHYDSDGLLAVLTVGARGWDQALTFAQKALEGIWIAGTLQTNQHFLAELLAHPWVREGMFHASFVDEEFVPQLYPEATVAQCFASICDLLWEREKHSEKPTQKGIWLVGHRWARANPESVTWLEPPRFWKVGEKWGVSGRLQVEQRDGPKELRFFAAPLSDIRWQVRLGDWCLNVKKTSGKPADQARLYSQLFGRVHALLYREGAIVEPHEPFLVIESLQTLVPHALPVKVKIVRWQVSAEDSVSSGQVLAELERIS
jgi:acetyl/propionyl-CoA carboxylase alpha subunit